MLDERVLRCRSANNFEERYLRMGFDEQITVLRILDSRKEVFKLSKAYQHKVSVINIITAPEIEMLLIHAEGKYSEFSKSMKKPSTFCKEDLKMKNVKSYDFVYQYFSDTDKLIKAIREYRRVAKIEKDEKTLFDILKK